MTSEGRYLADTPPDPAVIREWVETFHRDGFVFLPNVLPPEMCAELRDDLDRAEIEEQVRYKSHIQIAHRMFETSRANLRLLAMEPIVTFAEALIGHATQVLHNNSFRSPLGGG